MMINNDRILASMGTATMMSSVCPCPINFLSEWMGIDMSMARFGSAPAEPPIRWATSPPG